MSYLYPVNQCFTNTLCPNYYGEYNSSCIGGKYKLYRNVALKWFMFPWWIDVSRIHYVSIVPEETNSARISDRYTNNYNGKYWQWLINDISVGRTCPCGSSSLFRRPSQATRTTRAIVKWVGMEHLIVHSPYFSNENWTVYRIYNEIRKVFLWMEGIINILVLQLSRWITLVLRQRPIWVCESESWLRWESTSYPV